MDRNYNLGVVAAVLCGGWKYNVQGVLQRMPGYEDACMPFFKKSVFLTWLFTVAMALCGLCPGNWRRELRTIMERPQSTKILYLLFIAAMGIVCSLLATITSTSLIDPALSEMLTSLSKLLILALISRFYFRYSFHATHYFACLCTVMALVTLYFSDSDEPDDSFMLGFILAAVVGPLFLTIKLTILEVLTHDYDISPYFCLVSLGVFSAPVCTILLFIANSLAGDDCGKLESWTDTWAKLSGQVGSTETHILLLILLFSYGLFVTGREWGGYVLIALSTNMEKNLWDFFRATVTWGTDLVLIFILQNQFVYIFGIGHLLLRWKQAE